MPQPPATPDPKPGDDGSYECDLCHQKVRIGGGGAKNFVQHRGSPACLKAAKQNKTQANQAGNKTKTLLLFFSKVTHSPRTVVTPTSGPICTTSLLTDDNRSSVARTHTLPQSRLRLPSPTLSHQSSIQGSLSAEREGYRQPDAYALALLAKLDRAVQELPIDVPEAEAHDEIACVLSVGDPDDPSEAWECLYPVLNRLLGFGSSLEDIAQHVRRGLSCFVSDWSCFASVSYGLPLGPSSSILSYFPHACCLNVVMWCVP
jgi:hypothetical protein